MDPNPYAPPASEAVPEHDAATGEWKVTCVRRGFHSRKLRIDGSRPVTVYWNARWITEYIDVDGRRMRSRRNASFSAVPRFEFDLSDGVEMRRVVIEVRSIAGFWLTAFGLYLDGRLVYLEGSRSLLP
jgi:hypothetical protein